MFAVLIAGLRMPKVSVLTPIYKTNPVHLREMIESILNQTFTDFEFLILNDSPDDFELDKVVGAYKDRRIVYLKNDVNMGITASRNRLMQMAKGEYIAIFDHDDISLPDRLERQVAILDGDSGIGVVSGWLQFFGLSDCLWRNPEKNYEIKVALMHDCALYHTAAMIRKSVLVDNDIQYEGYFSPAEDYRLWTRLINLTNFYNIQDVLVKYRWYGSNTSVSQKMRMHDRYMDIRLAVQNENPGYYDAYKRGFLKNTVFRLVLFGCIPLFKVKRNWVWLFGFIPLFRVKWD